VSNVSQLSSGTFRGGSALSVNGATQTILTQTGSNRILGPNRRIIFGFWAKRVSGSASPTTPIVEMNLLNASTGASIATVDTDTGGPAISSSWALYTDAMLNSYYAPVADITVQFDINPGVANVYAIDCALCLCTHAGRRERPVATDHRRKRGQRIGDYATVQITNNYASTVLELTPNDSSHRFPAESNCRLRVARPLRTASSRERQRLTNHDWRLFWPSELGCSRNCR
jgi:hypothetical protein